MIDRETDIAPPDVDGRNVDPALGALTGEGALQRVRQVEPDRATPRPASDEDTYYGMPVLKEPVWKWYVPAYFYVGGLAGASAALGAAAMLRPELAGLSSATRIVAAGGAVVSGVLLIADLGRPLRFLYMLRVFRPSSPMNLGTWILSAFGASAVGALVFPWLSIAAGILGIPLTGYTAVLLANTAVPIWQQARTALPPLFMASAATAASSLLEMLPLDEAAEQVARRAAIAAKLSELVAGFAVDRECGGAPRVAEPLHRGLSGALWTGAKIFTALSLAVSLLPRKPFWLRIVGGALGSLGSLGVRFAMVEAGRASARDPRATFAPQRAAH